MSEDKLGVTTFKGRIMVRLISETRAGHDRTMELVDPRVLREHLRELRSKGRRVTLPDHPTLKSPRGYPHACYGRAGGCSQCVRCIMDYYADEVIDAVREDCG